ncbi:MAG: NUDIX hydrolase [Rhizobiales bacterium 65-9]|nr:MAG: NUDIX hydrolase [Rhizobiales bacterium 65-9]
MTLVAEPVVETPETRRWPYMRPKDAATLIVIDRSCATPKVLMGKRHAGHKFMPGKFVFPGGRLEPGDRRMVAAGALHDIDERRLAAQVVRPSGGLGRALALAAIRETFEETGLLIGDASYGAPESAPAGVWEAFCAHGVFPALEPLHFISRAITPPNRPKRFDTRFFAVDADAIAKRIDGVVGADSELTELVWIPLPEAPTLDLPPITHTVLKELERRIEAGFGRHLPVWRRAKLNGKWLTTEL